MGSTGSRASTTPARLLALALWIPAPLVAQVWEVGNQALERAAPESFDRFGWRLAVGDFDGDGRGDLAIGIPGRAVGEAIDAGIVQILYGTLFADGFERATTGGWPLP